MIASSSASLLDSTIDKYESLLNELARKPKDAEKIGQELLLLRDRLAALLQESGTFDPATVSRISALDKKLRSSGKLLDCQELEKLRALVKPRKRNWWWYLESPSPVWTIAALFTLTVSIALLTDFTRRLLNSDPDEIGLLSIAVQALFTVGATSTFTTAGQEAMNHFLARFGAQARSRPAIKLGATLVLFAVVFWAWKFVPGLLAWHYNDVAFRQQSSDSDLARIYYSKAISLNPANVVAHFNLGALYEKAYEYDKAAAEYRRAIMIDPKHVRAYSNLSRLLLLGNDPAGALQAADDALKLGINEGPEVTPVLYASLYRNRALAEYAIGLYQQAEADAKLGVKAMPDAADPYCVLAKVYSKQDRKAEARIAWQDFLARVNTTGLQPRLEPDCAHLAAEALSEPH